MKTKKMAMGIAAIALVGAVGIGSTMAYLSDTTETVTNTFTVGQVQIKLDEAAVEYVDGRGFIEDGDAARVVETANETYANAKIVPGDEIFKDPTITVADDSVNSYIFMEATGIDAAKAAGYEIAITDNWTLVKAAEGKKYDGVYAYKATGETAEMTAVAENFESPAFFTNDKITYSTTNTTQGATATITFKAYAVQASHVTDVATALTAIGK